MTNKFEEIAVAPNLRRSLNAAQIIACVYDDDYIRNAFLIFGFLKEKDCCLFKYVAEGQIMLDSDSIAVFVRNNRDQFVKIFGEKAAEKCFERFEEIEDKKEIVNTPNEENEKIDENEQRKDEIYDTVTNVILDLFGVRIDDETEDFDLSIEYSDKLQDVLNVSAERCFENNVSILDADNVLYEMLQRENTSGYKLLSLLFNQLNYDFDSEYSIEDLISYIQINSNIYEERTKENKITIPKILESCCTFMNEFYEKGTKSDILCRDKEKKQIWRVLLKKNKRNPLLVGPAGCGKSAIVEAIVQEIVNEECPKEFIGYNVISFSVESAVAGTKYRGDFEQKVVALTSFLEKIPNVILFIDEVHKIKGAGSASDTNIDLGGALKPVLARGIVRVIGATTNYEYEKYLVEDSALDRRFEKIYIKEPKHDEVKTMTSLRIENLSKFHGVSVSTDLIDYMIVCASAFNLNGTNPDKTLDLCDKAMVEAKMRNSDVLERKDVDSVYEDNYILFEKMIKSAETTAYHEAGHYVASRLLGHIAEEEMVIALSIVPGEGFLGAYIYDIEHTSNKDDYLYYKHKIMTLLAGRISQTKFAKSTIDQGASNDIEKATKIAIKMVTEFSLTEEFFDTFVLDVQSPLYSDCTKDKVLEKAKEILKECKDATEKFFDKPEVGEKVKTVANLLLKKHIVTAEELEVAMKNENGK